jgi:Leucine Rich repeat
LPEGYIGDEGAEKLARVLIRNKNISLIDLKGNSISGKGFVKIFEALKTNFNLKSLNLEWNRLGGGSDLTGMEALCSFL